MRRGTSLDQDARFEDKTKKMLLKSQWPDKYDIKIDLNKVDLELVRVWIQKKVASLMGEQDDIISGTVFSHLEQSIQKEEKLNAKVLHVAVTGLMQDKTLAFMSDLWDILEEAQRSPRGIPESLVEQKKKGEDSHRRKLDQLANKRMKINNTKLNNVIKRYAQRSQSPKRDRSPKRERSPRRYKQSKRKHKNRSRSRSRSYKRRRSYSRQQDSREKRHKHKSKHIHQRDRESYQKAQKKAHKQRQRQREASAESQSSDVLSSSEEKKSDDQ